MQYGTAAWMGVSVVNPFELPSINTVSDCGEYNEAKAGSIPQWIYLTPAGTAPFAGARRVFGASDVRSDSRSRETLPENTGR